MSNKIERHQTKVACMETVAAMGSTVVPQVKGSAVPLTEALVGVAVTTIDNFVKGIIVSRELERLFV